MDWIKFDALTPVERARELVTALRNEATYSPQKQWKHVNGKNVLCDPKPKSRKSDVLAKLVLDDLKQGRLPETAVEELQKILHEGV